MKLAVTRIIGSFPPINRKMFPKRLFTPDRSKEQCIADHRVNEQIKFLTDCETYETIFQRWVKDPKSGKFSYLPITYQLKVTQDNYLAYQLVTSSPTNELAEPVEVLFREALRLDKVGFRLYLHLQEQVFEYLISEADKTYFNRDRSLTVDHFHRLLQIKYISSGSTIAKDDICNWCDKTDAPFQFFITPPLQYGDGKRKPLQLDRSIAGKAYLHAPYVVNLADDKARLGGVIADLKEGQRLGLKGVTIHTGKSSNSTEKKVKAEVTPTELQEAIDRMYVNVKLLLEQATTECPLLIETPAGRGTELLDKFDDMLLFYRRFGGDQRLGITIDSCHVWAAGADPLDYLMRMKVAIGPGLRLVHYNDSCDPQGSGLDNHFAVGGTSSMLNKIVKEKKVPTIVTGEFGYIGPATMIAIGEFCLKHNIDFVKE